MSAKTPLALVQPKVIDPDDRAEMERFARLGDEAWKRVRDRHPERVGTPTWEIVAEQFRLFRDPTYRIKPDEPMGLGAVIEDEKDRKWVRGDGDTIGWTHAGDWRHYDEINAVRILSEGVQS